MDLIILMDQVIYRYLFNIEDNPLFIQDMNLKTINL